MATEFATDLGEKLKHEGEKLRTLELVTRPLRKPEPQKKHSKLGMLMLVIAAAGAVYALYRMLRPSTQEPAFTPRQQTTADTKNGSEPENRFATASR
ncbi:MAG TPA: hypothetical protein VHD87_00345 [Acidimicrobiales bacterium]|nr:hypothetical protein [Acidimicrobiales bacterium]